MNKPLSNYGEGPVVKTPTK